MDAAAEAGGALLGAGLMGLMEMESFEYLRIGYGLRQQDQIKFPSEEDEYPVSFNTLEVGVGFGHFGIFVGGGLSPSYLASPVTNPSGYTAFGGLEYVILYNDNGYDLSLCAEGGYGSLSIEKTHNFPDVFYENYKSTFYGVGVGVTLFQYLHLSYTYGMHTGERTRDTGSEILPVDEIEGYYSRVGIGIKFGLWYM